MKPGLLTSGLAIAFSLVAPTTAFAQENRVEADTTPLTDSELLTLASASTTLPASDDVSFEPNSRQVSTSFNLATDDVAFMLSSSAEQRESPDYEFTVTPGVAIATRPADAPASILISDEQPTSASNLYVLADTETGDFSFLDDSYSTQPFMLAQESTDDDVDSETDDDSDEESDERAWKFEFTPYAFLPLNVSGTSTVEGITADIDMDLGEVLDILTFAAYGRLEAWNNNRFGIIFEGAYTELGDDGENVLTGPRDLLELDLEVDVKYQQAFFDLAFGYRTEIDDDDDDDKTSQAGLPDGLFDVYAGIRVQYLNQTLDVDAELIGPRGNRRSFSEEFGGDETWVEPLLGARLAYQASPRWKVGARTDISGFAIDGLSLTWRLAGGFDWVFSGNTSLLVGYQLYTIDFETGDGRDKFGLDQLQHGPYLGVTFRF